MAIECWIWGNANQADQDLQEYQIRLCGGVLRAAGRKDRLIELSNRMLAVTKRRGVLRTQRCWFAGYLDKEVYLVALAGEQNSLLGTNLVGSRGLYGMLAYGFTGKDIRRIRRDEDFFEPLKALLRAVNETGQCPAPGPSVETLAELCAAYADESPAVPADAEGNNIIRSNLEADEYLWRQSLSRPTATGILSADDAERLLDRFPDGAVSVAEDVSYWYQPRIRKTEALKKDEKEVTETLREARQAQANQEQEAREKALREKMAQKEAAQAPKKACPQKPAAEPASRLGGVSKLLQGIRPDPPSPQEQDLQTIVDFLDRLPALKRRIDEAMEAYLETYQRTQAAAKHPREPLTLQEQRKMKAFCRYYVCRYGCFPKNLLQDAYRLAILPQKQN